MTHRTFQATFELLNDCAEEHGMRPRRPKGGVELTKSDFPIN